jgi:hypothetical protein
MKLELYGLIQSLLEAGGKFENGVYILQDDNGLAHREEGPAIIWPNGKCIWCRHGQYHRDDGPAVVCPDGTQEWFLKDVRHREDGPAAIYPDGTRDWYTNGYWLRESK